MYETPTCPHCFSRCIAEMHINMFRCDKPHGTLGPYEISGQEAADEYHARKKAKS
jgi:hypothetical protein